MRIGANRLLEIPLPQPEHLAPGLFGGDRRIRQPLGKEEAVLRARVDFDFMPRAGLVEGRAQIRDHVRGHRGVDFGEAVVELALDLVEQQVPVKV